MRHGEPEGGDRYRGSVDDPLSSNGWDQMRRVVADYRAWDVVITSPLQRCSAFAHEISERLAVPLETEHGFREMGFGLWEGRTAEEIMRDDRRHLVRFWRNPLQHPPPGGESLQRLRRRVMIAWDSILTRHASHRILLVTHGGVIRVILGHVLSMPLEHLSRLYVPYAALSRIRIDTLEGDAMPRLIFHAGCIIS